MATKAQRYREEIQKRAHHETPKNKKRTRTLRPVVPNPGAHNLSKKAARKASYERELSLTQRPSRKAGRKSLNRQKTDSALRITTVSAVHSPKARSQRRGD
jgi:hypothetical protein